MTIPEKESTREQEQSEEQVQPQRPIVYQVSFERLDELHRSVISILADRRPQSSPSRQSPDIELTNPKKLLDEIAEHAATDELTTREAGEGVSAFPSPPKSKLTSKYLKHQGGTHE